MRSHAARMSAVTSVPIWATPRTRTEDPGREAAGSREPEVLRQLLARPLAPAVSEGSRPRQRAVEARAEAMDARRHVDVEIAHRDVGGHSRRKSHVEKEPISLSAPADRDAPVRAVELCLRPLHAGDRLGGDGDTTVSGLRRCEAGEIAVHPVGYGSQRVVVERGHLAGVDAAVGEHRVPALPHRRRPHRDGVQPRRALGLQEESAGCRELPAPTRGFEDAGSPGEAGRDAMTVRLHELREPRSRPADLIGVEEIEGEGEGVGRLAVVPGPLRLVVHEGGAEGLPRGVPESLDLGHLARASEDARGLGGQLGGPVEARRRDEGPIGLRRGGVIRGGVRVEPVSELEAAIPQASRREEPLDVTQVGQHRREIPAQDRGIA